LKENPPVSEPGSQVDRAPGKEIKLAITLICQVEKKPKVMLRRMCGKRLQK
jgi:hypothetical protein